MSKNGTVDNSSYDFESYSLGGKYVFRDNVSRFTMALSLDASQTLYSAPEGSSVDGKMILGDAGMTFLIGAHLNYKIIKYHNLSTSVYYQILPEDLGTAIIYNVESSWPYEKAAFVIGADGLYSINKTTADVSASSTSYNTGVTTIYNNGTQRYVAPFVALSLSLGNWTLGAKAAQRFMGYNTDKANEFGLFLRYNKNGSSPIKQKIEQYKEYEVEASVIKVSPRGKFVKIDQGSSSDITVGMKFDIYKTDYFGGNILIASGIVAEVGFDWAIVNLGQKFNEMEIKDGYTARGY